MYKTEADQFSSDKRGADFPRGVHRCATKELTEHCSSFTTVVGYDFTHQITSYSITLGLLAEIFMQSSR